MTVKWHNFYYIFTVTKGYQGFFLYLSQYDKTDE